MLGDADIGLRDSAVKDEEQIHIGDAGKTMKNDTKSPEIREVR